MYVQFTQRSFLTFIEGESFALVGVPVFTGLHRATSLRSLQRMHHCGHAALSARK